MEVEFARQKYGHLVIISSMSALRGLRGGLTAYAARAMRASPALAEGIRADMLRKPVIQA